MVDYRRQTAYRLSISDINDNPYIKTDGDFEPNYIDLKGKLQVGRVRVIGDVTMTYFSPDGNYGSIGIDDGTGNIRVKIWKDTSLLEGLEKGQTVDLIGKVRQWNDENYIVPEAVRLMESSDVSGIKELRALDISYLKRRFGIDEDGQSSVERASKDTDPKEVGSKNNSAESSGSKPDKAPKDSDEDGLGPKEEEISTRRKIIAAIGRLDEGDGAVIDDVIDSVDADDVDIEKEIEELLSDGTCYEPRAGKIKIL